MRSLRLSIAVTDVNIRSYSQRCNASGSDDGALVGGAVGDAPNACWVALRLA